MRIKSKEMMSLRENWNFKRLLKLSTFLALKSPVLNFLNFLSSRALLSEEPLSYKKPCTSKRIQTGGI